MIVRFDALDRFETPSLLLCNPGAKREGGAVSNSIGYLTDTSDEEIVFNFNAVSELSFRLYKVKHDDADENAYALEMYRKVQNRRLIYVQDIGFFSITSVSEGYSDEGTYKDVTASSAETELQAKGVPYINGTYEFNDLMDALFSVVPNWEFDDEVTSSSPFGKYRTFEDVDVNKNLLSFLLEDVQQAYECIFVFDIITRTVQVFDQNNYVVRTNIHLTKGDLINELTIEEGSEDLYTAISVTGSDDDINILSVNPLGTNVIYNFDYYLDWMSDGLRDLVEDWYEDIAEDKETIEDLYIGDGYTDPVTSVTYNYYQAFDLSSNAEMEADRLEELKRVYSNCRTNILSVLNESDVSKDEAESYVSEANQNIRNAFNVELEYTASSNPSASDIEAFVTASRPDESTWEDFSVIVHDTNHIWRYVEVRGTWQDSGSFAVDDVDDTQTIEEIKLNLLSAITTLIETIDDDIVANELALTQYSTILTAINGQVSSIRTSLNMSIYFGAYYSELVNYIFEGEYSDEYITVGENMTYEEKFGQYMELYNRAEAQLQRISYPTQEFSINVGSFLFVKEFEPWSNQLQTGSLINVELEDNDVAALFMSSLTVNYYDHDMSMTFGNRFNRFDTKALYENVLGGINKTANSVNYINDVLYPIKRGALHRFDEAINNSRNLSVGGALAASNQSVVIDDSGYLAQKVVDGDTDGKQLKITNNCILFTDDGWETAKIAIGEIFNPLYDEDNPTVAPKVIYGISAESIFGNLIAGSHLVIKSPDNQPLFEVGTDDNGNTYSHLNLTTVEDSLGKLQTRYTEETAAGTRTVYRTFFDGIQALEGCITTGIIDIGGTEVIGIKIQGNGEDEQSGMYSVFTANELGFYDHGDNKQAWISDSVFHAPQLEVEKQLTLGQDDDENSEWLIDFENGLSISWIGD